MILKNFQEEAVENLVHEIQRLLDKRKTQKEKGNKQIARVILKSPTGSGKTMMAAQILKELEPYFNDRPFAFIWAAPNKLHLQSHRKLASELAETRYNLIDVEDLQDGPLEDDTVVFTNWEKIFKQDKDGNFTNVAVRESENGKNLQDVMEATRAAGIGMMLIVDESHQTFYGPHSQALVNEVIKPDLVFEISATPKMGLSGGLFDVNMTYIEEVNFNDVVDSGLIKKEIIINNDVEKEVDDKKGAIEVIIDSALKKRKDLAEEYKKIGKDINPLVLVQLPNNKEELSDVDKKDLDIIEELLAQRGFSYHDGTLGIWLSNDKKNLENIERNDNGVQVLIFKQAIALGWDCPRAQILVMLRDVKSETFKIQTVGRILRMPEAKHYGNDELDSAYVFTDLPSIIVDPEDKDGQNLIKVYHSKRVDGRNIDLPDSVFLHRTDYGDLRADFKPVLKNLLDQTFSTEDDLNMPDFRDKINEKLEIYPEELQSPIISNETIKNLDEYSADTVKTIKTKMDQPNVELIFNITLRSYCGRFKNFARSKGIVCGTLYSWFGQGGIYPDEVERIIACSRENQEIFRGIFEAAIDQYDSLLGQEMKERRDREVEVSNFTIPDEDSFSEKYEIVSSLKNAIFPYYRRKDASAPEKTFEAWLEQSEKVQFWYKNGEKQARYFAVIYNFIDANAKTRRGAFYPDYLVRFTDGSTGIYDTKSGFTSDNEFVKQKADGLQRYIASHEELNLKGGIIDYRRNEFYIQDGQDYDKSDPSKWRRII